MMANWCVGIKFVEADAMDLHMIDDESVDAYTISFGLRNVTDQDKALRSLTAASRCTVC